MNQFRASRPRSLHKLATEADEQAGGQTCCLPGSQFPVDCDSDGRPPSRKNRASEGYEVKRGNQRHPKQPPDAVLNGDSSPLPLSLDPPKESEPGYQPYAVDSLSLSVDSRLLRGKVETDCRIAPRLVGSPDGKNKHYSNMSGLWLESNIEIVARDKKERVVEKLPLTLDSTDLQSYCHQLMDDFRKNRASSTEALSLESCYKEAA